ncbi:kinesin-like protein KIN-12E isoform X3 [Amborella trichopoda]|uniref:kinesin-like protein KIN-12E isoform X3 n=1 Tax=Amborella trichopoda TaxID=13333 RepID=UPI0009BD8902|nr:kinesin-like protein KIN-12E isoform X3 [Amborella trichopoda]|eukprot:XP_020520488.1 kinesin-like protein KIN-12E isoform X3 [Amborella trichopoda]
MSALKIFRKNGSKSSQTQEGNENRLENLCASSTALPPARPPLNLIPDPSQNPNPSSKFVSEKVTDQRPRLEVTPLRNHEKTCEESESQGTVHGNGSMHCTTPRSILGKGSMGSHSEPSSAQSTPTRNISRVFNHGSYGAYTCARLPQSSVGKGGGPSKAMRGLPILASSNLVQVPHFDLTEDPSFWTNHNVQVLIRIRPVSNKERSLQGYTRCLRQESAQTVTWLGHPEARFTFDHVACETITQEKLFKVAGLPMVENCMFGYNSCIFAYGQTGSGKTYTMMGEINDLEDELSEDCGMTPRIFEYLFAQIRAEEESRRDVKLNYVCKCSFLEIYNEQITDLLEPSSTNLQLREDAKKGVYVENLSEFEVRTVKDVLDLLVQGSANRKVASTNMNSESSRSHSVFTCAIESRWEADAMNHLRFGRLNLVDLAGSERQKNSGAEGERLKEAANINKSLSTLGLVIMTLVDVAQGRQRHVPYRDSRLTFLLQDSLGGNSKTAIIANISPSICCVNETLSTLKFAQRAKLIQNNAIVNEDASGDITALQRQIQQLKEEVTFLKHENISRSLPFRSSISGHFICSTGFAEYDSGQANDASGMIHGPVNYVDNLTANNLGLLSKKMKSIEATLAGSLRREKMAEIANNQLEAEIELMNRLIREREDEVYRSKTMLKFQEEKTRRLESFVGGTKPADDYLLEENNALYEEIQLLQGKIDSNPELTWFELENKRLLEQLRLFQDFYEEGEREIMHAEVSELRDQLCEVLEGKLVQNNCPTRTTLQLNLAAATEENVSLTMKADATLQELEDCKKNLGACLESNMRLTREVDDLHNQMKKYLKCKEPMLQKVEHSLFEFGDRTAEKLQENSVQLVLEEDILKAKASEKSNLNPRYSFFDHVSCDNPSDNLLEVSSNVRERKSDMFGDEYHESVETLTIEDQESHKDNDSNCNARFLEKADFHEVVDNVMSNDAGIFHLKKEIDSSIMSLRNIHVLLNGMSDNEEPREPYEQKEYYNDVVNSNTENRQAEMDHKDEQHKLAMLEMEHKLQTFEDWIEKAEAEWRKTRELLHLEHIDAELVAAEKSDLVKSLLMKFEEAHETMKEADWLLNALMKENESAKHEAYQLKKVGEGLMAERTSLIADIQSLKSSICLKEDQYKILQDQVNSNILEIKGSISSLELSLTQVQGDIKDTFMKVWYEICSFGKDILDYFGTVDSWQVDILSEIIERSFYLYVVHQCYIESFHEKLNSSNVNAHFYQHVRRESDITAANLSVAHLKIKGAIGKNDGTSGIEKEAEFELSKCKASRSADIEKKLDMVNTVGVSNGNFVDFDAAFCPKQELSLHLRLEKIEKLEEEKLALTQDIRKLKQGIYRQLADIDRIRDDLAKHKTFSDSVVCLNGHDNLNMNTVMTRLSGLGTEESILSDDQCLDCTRILNGIEPCHLQFQNYGMDSRRSVNRGIEKDIAGTIMDVNSWCIKIQNIKRQCSGFLAPAKENEEGMYESYPQMAHKGSNKGDIQNNIAMFGLEEEVGPQDLVEMNTESVCDSIQAMEILREKFTYLKDNVPSIKPVENESTDASLEMLLQRISIIEEKLFKYISVCSKLQRIKISAISDNLSLKRELDRKDELLKGLLFDISLLQESASEAKDQKDELEGARDALNCAQNELAANTAELDGIMVQYRKVEVQLANKETVVCSLKLELDQANKTLELIADENIQLKDIFEELYAEKSAAEVELEEKSKVIEGLEKEISNLDSSAGQGAFQSFLGIKNELKHFSNERDHLRAQVVRLNGQLDMAKALADENEAIAIEARELSEASKAYAEEKEEEAKILEHSVEELESTVNVLEKKVYEMAEEVERQRLSREHLEFELQSLRHKFSVEQEATGSLYLENPVIVERKDAQFSRHTEEGELELHEARRCIQALEKEKLDRENEIRQCKDYISELVLHAEAQALQYQQKYKNLEAMAREVQTDSVPLIGAMTGSRMEKASARTRGSGSPFKCISALVHQMNSEKDQELSLARHRIEELEGLAALRQKEICMLSARLAAAESMTHDVIRDLLGVKLDMTNYANVLDQQLVQKLAEKAQEHYEGFQAEENFKLREQINDLIKKKDSWAEETNQIQAELLAAKVTAEQLRQRGLMLTAQNEMLKMDKEKLKRRLSELEASSKRIPGSRKPSQQTQ